MSADEVAAPLKRPARMLTFDHAGTPMRFLARRLLAGGYTGRDPAAVEEHIAELALLGVPRPAHVPWIFVANPQVLQVDGAVWAYDGTSSGEAEYVLLIGRDDVFVCIGSDHTDRGLESLSIEKSKQIYPKILSRQVWRLDDLLPRWDDLRLRSRVGEAASSPSSRTTRTERSPSSSAPSGCSSSSARTPARAPSSSPARCPCSAATCAQPPASRPNSSIRTGVRSRISATTSWCCSSRSSRTSAESPYVCVIPALDESRAASESPPRQA